MLLSEQFHKYFTVSLAQTPDEMFRAYQLRFQVYCEEFGYLDPRDRPYEEFVSGIELDEFDDRSLHCLITHRRTGELAGCVRVVTTQSGLHEDPLPLEKYCLPSLSLGTLELLAVERCQVGEISRLTVAPQFRCRSNEQAVQYGSAMPVPIDSREVRSFSLIGIAALMGAAASLESLGLTQVFAMMNPALPRLLRRSGMIFTQAGFVTDYHGKRAPYHMSVDSFQENLPGALERFYDDLRAELGRQADAGQFCGGRVVAL